jgi:hypothetical protein
MDIKYILISFIVIISTAFFVILSIYLNTLNIKRKKKIKILGIVNKDYEWAFPVDTWVSKIAHKLGCNDKGIEEIKQYLIKKCKDTDIDPLKFAVGLWFLGFHSLDILLENCLDEIEI